MASLFPRITTWVSNQILTASALNGEFNNILNNMQMSSIVGYSSSVAQMQQQTSPGGVGSESLSGSSSDELQRMRFMMAYVLGKSYWYDQTGSTLGALGIKAGSFAAGAIATADIANGAVTPAKLGTLNYVVTTTANAATASTTWSSINNGITVATTPALTISGARPVYVFAIGNNIYQSGATNAASNWANFNISSTMPTPVVSTGFFQTLPQFNTIQSVISGRGMYNSANDVFLTGTGTSAAVSSTQLNYSGSFAPSCLNGVYIPNGTAGSYTFSLNITCQSNNAGTAGCNGVSILAIEA